MLRVNTANATTFPTAATTFPTTALPQSTRTLKYYGRFPYFLEMFLEIQMPKWTHIPNSLWKRFWNFFHNSSIFDFENMEA
jgi:hypothetical protein